MMCIETEGRVAAAGPAGALLEELPLADRPSCPGCEADPGQQTTLAWWPDGIMEIVILVCSECHRDHPVWV